jgi:Leucine-rich repeat (LRR) protein
LPLSLKVFGGLLYGNNVKSYWKAQLDRLQTLPSEIQKRLQISYDALHREEQQIFLDIVCFFIGENLDTAIRVWEGSGWKALVGFQNLQDKSLVEVGSFNEIKVHGHLRDMGREIIEASGSPRCLGHPTENIDDVLQRLHVITEVRGIRTVVSGHSDNLEYKCFSSEMSWYKRRSHEWFGKRVMKLSNRVHNRKLQLLDIENGHLVRILRKVHLPNLLWLRWRECPYYSLPSWIPMENLRVLQVYGSVLKTLWQSKSQAPLQLRELVINSPLSKLPKSIGQLKHLQLIILGRSNLKALPEEFCYLRLLKRLELTNCSEIKSLPDSFGYLANLEHINLSGSVNLEELPISFGDLIRLKYLDLEFCSNLTISDETLGNISTLEYIDLSCCWKIEILPPQVAHQRSLEKLYCPFLEMVPSPLGRNLKQMILHNCTKELKCLPISVGLLAKLTVKNCPLRELPLKNVEEGKETVRELRGQRRVSNLDSSIDKCMLRLQHLRLYDTKISMVSFPEDVFPNLQHLQISACNDLVEVGALPNALIKLELTCCDNLRKIEGLCSLSKLQVLDISWWEEVEELPDFEKLLSLEELWAYGCSKLKSIKGLARLTKLRVLDVRWCCELHELPNVEHCMSLEYLGAIGCSKLHWAEGVLEQLRLRVKDLENERRGRIQYMKSQEEEDEEGSSAMTA